MGDLVEIKIPDLGDFSDVEIVEVMVKPGDTVSVDDPLITIESEKASMEVPSPQAGRIKELKVKLGDKVSEGSLIVVLESDGAGQSADAAPATSASPEQTAPASVKRQERKPQPAPAPTASANGAASQVADASQVQSAAESTSKPHASPSVRKFARELGVDLERVKGSGLHDRIFRADIEKFVKSALANPESLASRNGAGAAFDIAPWPKVDFAKFGPVETKPLSRIRKFSKANLARNWVMIPHVTQFDEADVTELEAFRREINEAQPKDAARVTMLAFIMKALVPALTEFPEFNASLEADNLVLKKYFHIGFAADTAEGLVVPVIRDVDKKGVTQIARETAALAATARDGKLKPLDIQGGCFTISSLGGVGGTAFTPIINAPEVAILGVSKLAHKPVFRDGALVPRLMLPLSLSYDHRVNDGATAARFTTRLCAVLADMRRALL
jgi:pyruvate dehydrogenase E2 component (dihydrolipoamide acetyltransferase)